MKITLANINDLKQIVKLHCLSFTPKNHVPMMLGENYVKATYRWLINSNDAYVLIIKENDLIIGLVAVCDGPFTKKMFISCLPDFIISIFLKPKRLFSKMLWKRLFRRPDVDKEKISVVDEPGFAQMTIGAVDSNYRGSGVFGKLIKETKTTSRARGSKAIRAGVYKKNRSSRRVFEKSAWIEIKYLETEDTVFYTSFFDLNFKKKIMSL